MIFVCAHSDVFELELFRNIQLDDPQLDDALAGEIVSIPRFCRTK
jgi:hypothetical protein